MMYTYIVKNFFRNPFQSPLTRLIDDLTPSKSEISRAQKAMETVIEQMRQLSSQNILPPLSPDVATFVGSYFRGTALSPLKHIDIFLIFDSSLVDIHEDQQVLNLVAQNSLLSSCVDESLHLLPNKLVSTLLQSFSTLYPATISTSGQTIKMLLEKYSLEVRITPAFAWDHSFYVPAEKSELLWKKVSPGKERQRLAKVDEHHNHFIIPLIRYIKRWNMTKNNESFRNYHVEAIAYFIFEEIPTPANSLVDAIKLYVKQMSRYIYNCPDPTNLSTPVHTYLPDNIDQWYLFMNRISELKTAVENGERAMVDFVTQSSRET